MTTAYSVSRYSPAELDLQYNARATVPDVTPYLQEYAQLSAAARSGLPRFVSLHYGDHADETLDIFPAQQPNAPVFVFIHGGYWRALSKDDSSFMAPCFHQAGATVVAINYTLAPEASLDRIVDQCRRAMAWLYSEVGRYHGNPRAMHVSGSSAGGHLTGMMLATDWLASYGLPQPFIQSASVVSGLFELAPLINTTINTWAKLDAESARRLSPLHHLPDQAGPLVVSCGDTETAEFRRQSETYMQAWQARGHSAQWVEMPNTNHFNVITQLAKPESALTQAVFKMMGLV